MYSYGYRYRYRVLMIRGLAMVQARGLELTKGFATLPKALASSIRRLDGYIMSSVLRYARSGLGMGL